MKNLTDIEIESGLRICALKEREALADLLAYIREADCRRLYLKRAKASLFAFLTEDFRFSPAAAQRRIDASRLSEDLPEVLEQIREGALSLSQIGALQRGIRYQEKKTAVSRDTKRSALSQVLAAPARDADRVVASFFEMPIVRRTKMEQQADDSVRLSVTIPPEVWKELGRCRELLAHKVGDPDWPEVLAALCELYLKAKDPLRRAAASAAEVKPKEKETGTGPIPARIRRLVFQRDRVCQYRDHTTGRICGSSFRLEVDHIRMRCHGGTNEPTNLRLLCRAHNQQAAEDALGTGRVGRQGGHVPGAANEKGKASPASPSGKSPPGGGPSPRSGR